MNTEKNNVIENQAFTELLVSCQLPGCSVLFAQCLEHPAADPVEDWARRMAALAVDAG